MTGDIAAVVFDVDGVLTDTASLHFEAWTALFDEILVDGEPAFTVADYDRLVDGRPRADGLRAVIDDRGRVCDDLERLLARKQELFVALIERRGVRCYPDVAPCFDELGSSGISLAAASASRNATRNLREAGLLDRLDVVVDGLEAAELGLAGKPAADLFLEVARRLTIAPRRCLLVEDAPAGLVAGKAGGFGLVVGIDRSPGAGRQLDRWADVVIASLAELRSITTLVQR